MSLPVLPRAVAACLLLLASGSAATGPADAATQLNCSPAGATRTLAEVMAANTPTSESPRDYAAAAVRDLPLKGSATIDAPGTYRLHGNVRNGHITVTSTGNGVVRLILAGVTVVSDAGPALWIQASAKTVLLLEKGSRNSLTDAATRAPNDKNAAALYSSGPLAIGGSGSLAVTGRFADGIASTSTLVIAGGALTVRAVDDGVRGKQSVLLRGGSLEVQAGGDGIRSSGKAANSVGYVLLSGARVSVRAQADGIQGLSDVVLAAGTVRVDAAGTALKSSCLTWLGGGAVTLKAGGAAVQSDGEVVVRGGRLTVSQAQRGLVGRGIAVSAGTLTLTTRDDAVHGDAASTTGATASTTPPTYSNQVPEQVRLDGGTFILDAGANGIDAKGSLEVTGGRIVVSGSATDTHTALSAATLAFSGATLLALDASGFASSGAAGATPSALRLDLPATRPAGSVLHVLAADGTAVAHLKARKPWRSLLVLSPRLVRGGAYRVLLGGAVSGTSTGISYPSGSTRGARVLATVTAG